MERRDRADRAPSEEGACGAAVRVRLKYLSALREKAGRREETLELPPGSRLRDLAAWVEQRRGLALSDRGIMATLNGRGWTQLAEGRQTELQEGDQVVFFPLVSGG